MERSWCAGAALQRAHGHSEAILQIDRSHIDIGIVQRKAVIFDAHLQARTLAKTNAHTLECVVAVLTAARHSGLAATDQAAAGSRGSALDIPPEVADCAVGGNTAVQRHMDECGRERAVSIQFERTILHFPEVGITALNTDDGVHTQQREPQPLKGFAEPIPVCALSADVIPPYAPQRRRRRKGRKVRGQRRSTRRAERAPS